MSALVAPALVGDGVENPHNVRALLDAAGLFGWGCAFRDRGGLQADWPDDAARPVWVDLDELRACSPLVGFDNGRGARTLYGFRPGHLDTMALVVGNERRGLSWEVEQAAETLLEVPMASGRVNSLNVAAAAAVALYYLSRGGGGKLLTRADPHRKRPEVLLLGAGDHAELGSAIRSAAAFGWKRALVEDREGVWFGVDRVRRSESRAAARRGKNSIRLVPTKAEHRYGFEDACVVGVRSGGRPLARVNLARGPRQLVVIGDEEHVALAAEEASDRLGARIERATIELPDLPVSAEGHSSGHYRYRLIASIVLAEIARQVGVRTPKTRRRARPPIYDKALLTLAERSGETVTLDELTEY